MILFWLKRDVLSVGAQLNKIPVDFRAEFFQGKSNSNNSFWLVLIIEFFNALKISSFF